MDYDVIVVGAGPGGYVAALYAASHGLKTGLVEKDATLGGTCLNRGCIPTKALLQSAELFYSTKNLHNFGIETGNATYNWAQVQARKDKIVSNLERGVRSLVKGRGITFLQGTAHLLDGHQLEVERETETRVYSARHILLATGSSPNPLPVPGGDLPGVVSSDGALTFSQPPTRLVIVGGGVIGVEFAHLYNRLGTEVTILEMLPGILGNMDEEIALGLGKALKGNRVKIHTDVRVQDIVPSPDGLLVTAQDQKGTRIGFPCDKVLVATGRRACLDVLGQSGVVVNRGVVQVDHRMQTSIPSIYAIGDMTGGTMLAHTASYQALVAVDTILGINRSMKGQVIPGCVYTHPEAASVGLTQANAQAQYGDNLSIGRFSFAANGKAMILGQNRGFIKVIAEKKWGQILGVHILGPQATELIAEAALAIQMECTANEWLKTIHAHPTLSEAVTETCWDLTGRPLHKG